MGGEACAHWVISLRLSYTKLCQYCMHSFLWMHCCEIILHLTEKVYTKLLFFVKFLVVKKSRPMLTKTAFI